MCRMYIASVTSGRSFQIVIHPPPKRKRHGIGVDEPEHVFFRQWISGAQNHWQCSNPCHSHLWYSTTYVYSAVNPWTNRQQNINRPSFSWLEMSTCPKHQTPSLRDSSIWSFPDVENPPRLDHCGRKRIYIYTVGWKKSCITASPWMAETLYVSVYIYIYIYIYIHIHIYVYIYIYIK